MPSWNYLVEELARQPSDELKADWLKEQMPSSLQAVSRQRNGRNVLLYGSGFLQKPRLPVETLQITREDLNGFMSCIHGMDWSSGLTLIIHTPGGITNAAETIVSYLRSKFDYIEAIIPAYAMSAGTMISLGANLIFMGRQSQLGPIDPQMLTVSGSVSAQAVVDQFEQAKQEIVGNPAAASAWVPILQSMGPALLVDARNALSYSESIVKEWLKKWMFAQDQKAALKATTAARHFNDANIHLSHGRRIDRDEARNQALMVEDLESSQDLQEAVLTAYHVMTLIFERTPTTKMIQTSAGKAWVKASKQPILN